MEPSLPPRRLARVASLLLVANLAWTSVGLAQVVEVTLRNETTHALVEGAIVRLVSSDGVVDRAMTGPRGQAVLHALTPGTFHIHVNRIGFAEVVSEPVQLTSGNTLRHTMLLPATVMTLPDVEVEARSQCGDHQRGGTAAAILWENVRTALTATVLTLEDAPLLRVTRFQRQVSTRGAAGPEAILSSRTLRGDPFQPFSPADLMYRGFVRQIGESVEYAGVDAAVLLSDEFTRTHCYRAVDGPEGLIGLAFEPTAERTVADISGVLWVDRETIELRRLEFSYTRLPTGSAPLAGGAAEFRRLPGGAWIVGEWFVRMPRLARQNVSGPSVTFPDAMVVGYLDNGGRAMVASAPEPGNRVAAAAAGTVVGMVYDSLAGGPIVGAVVSVSGEADSALTAEDGSFRLAVASAGERFLVVRHPRLGLISDGSSRLITVPQEGEVTVEVAVPPAAAFVRTFCGAQAGSAGVLGIAWGADGLPEAGLEIRTTWPGMAGGRISGAVSAGAQSTTRGVYALCGLPSGRELTIKLMAGVRELSSVSVRLEPGEFRWLDLGPRPPQ